MKEKTLLKTLLLLLSRFSCGRLCASLQTAAHQAPPSLGYSRREHWSALPFPSPMHESEKWKWSHSVVSGSSWPHGLQPHGPSSIHGIFQARVLEWGAIAFSGLRLYRHEKDGKERLQIMLCPKIWQLRWNGLMPERPRKPKLTQEGIVNHSY